MAVSGSPSSHAVEVHRLGRVAYEDGLAWQAERAASVLTGGTEAIALLEHEPVYTLGTRGSRAYSRTDIVVIEALGARVVQADRGGDITFHGPGQLVVYPILDLRRRNIRPGDYVRRLEQCAIETSRAFVVDAHRVDGRPGAWVRVDEKLAAIGVRIRGGISTHGLALNVSTDLAWFDAIVPCGLEGTGATSLERELGRATEHPRPDPLPRGEGGPESLLCRTEEALLEAFARIFEVSLVESQEAIVAL